jgi:hypothetical protein
MRITRSRRAHHAIALNEGGSNDAATNGQPLCFTCHRTIENARRRDRLTPRFLTS